MVWYCESCEEAGDTQSDIKHKADCAEKLKVIKVCTKSGTSPHVPDKK